MRRTPKLRPVPDAALVAALDQFGAPAAVAAAFAEELASSQARCTTVAYLVTGPLVGVWWLLVLAPPAWWRHGPPALWAAIPALPLIAIGCTAGVLVLAATGRPSRWLHPSARHLLQATVLLAAACMTGDLVVLAQLIDAAPTILSAPAGILAAIAATASMTRLGYSTRAVLRCRDTRRTLALR